MADDLLGIADTLYGLPLPDFTPTRDQRAKALKADDAELSRRVKALRKPATAAWVVNLLVRHETAQVDQVLAVGEALREAQASMSGEELRALTRQRRQLTAAVTTRARAVASRHGQRVTPAVADQVEATLTAAMVDADCAAAVRSGLLVAPLASTGVGESAAAEAVAVPEAIGFSAAAVEAAPEEPADRPGLRVVPDPEAAQKAVAAAREALDGAEEERAAAQEAFDAAAEDVAQLEARSMQVQAQIDELRSRLAELEASYEEVDDELGDAEDVRAEAEGSLAEATVARDAAARALAALEERA